MQYRNFGKLQFPVSTFGVGCMRFPTMQTSEGKEKVDEQEAIKMIRYAIDHGVNYIDTAYFYHGGESEIIVGKALQDGYREKVSLVTKCPVWDVEKYADFERFLDEQLEKLQVDYLDFYLMHALDKNRWEKIKALGFEKFYEEAIQKGKIKYRGFSFHDELSVFRSILDEYDRWDMCQIQLNILDHQYQAGVEGLRYAGLKGIPVVIMEPLKGGKLAQKIPADIEAIWEESRTKRSPVEWAFRWLYNFSEVAVILSGVSNMEQLRDNIKIFQEAPAQCMTKEEIKLVDRVREQYESKIKVGCTKCEYCIPCPAGVRIPNIFDLYNQSSMYGSSKEYAMSYQRMMEKNEDATQCVQCGQCENACPQHLPIIQTLQEAHKVLTE